MQIRLATANDLPTVMDLLGRIIPPMQATGNHQWDAAYPDATIFARDVELDQLWLAELDGQIAGFAAITRQPEPAYAGAGLDIHEPALVIHRLAVDPAVRGRGIARALMQQAETLARSLGIPALRVDTNKLNPAATQLFPRLGYTFAGEITLSFRPGLQVVVFEKRLP
jgi:GNAT superfamily N-acetyltransferase